jgi:DNA-binding NarL/FixJ family response regulator
MADDGKRSLSQVEANPSVLIYALGMTERGRLVLRALTKREQRVLALVASGLSNKAIATRFDTSEQVIKNSMREVLKKAGRRNRCELIIWVFHHGVVTCPCSHRSKEMRSDNATSSPMLADSQSS